MDKELKTYRVITSEISYYSTVVKASSVLEAEAIIIESNYEHEGRDFISIDDDASNIVEVERLEE